MLSKSKIKYIQSLGQKKFRQQEQLFLAEGPKILNELSSADQEIFSEIFAIPAWINENAAGFPSELITEITIEELQKISQLNAPNQVLAIVRQFKEKKISIGEEDLIIALAAIRDPGNFGTIIRIADWFGIKKIVCSDDCVEMYNSKVVQSTMGSIARVDVMYTNLENWLSGPRKMPVYVAALDGKDIASVGNIQAGVVIIGNESAGVSETISRLADINITIPRKGAAESLNAAVATGIILSHLVK